MNQCNSLSTLLPSPLRVNARYVHQLYEAPTSLCHRILFPLTSKGAIPNFDLYSSSALFNSVLPFFLLSLIRSRGLISTRISKHSIARFGSFILPNHKEMGLGCWCSGFFFFSLSIISLTVIHSLTRAPGNVCHHTIRACAVLSLISLNLYYKGYLGILSYVKCTLRYLSTGGLACLFIL